MLREGTCLSVLACLVLSASGCGTAHPEPATEPVPVATPTEPATAAPTAGGDTPGSAAETASPSEPPAIGDTPGSAAETASPSEPPAIGGRRAVVCADLRAAAPLDLADPVKELVTAHAPAGIPSDFTDTLATRFDRLAVVWSMEPMEPQWQLLVGHEDPGAPAPTGDEPEHQHRDGAIRSVGTEAAVVESAGWPSERRTSLSSCAGRVLGLTVGALQVRAGDRTVNIGGGEARVTPNPGDDRLLVAARVEVEDEEAAAEWEGAIRGAIDRYRRHLFIGRMLRDATVRREGTTLFVDSPMPASRVRMMLAFLSSQLLQSGAPSTPRP